MIEQYQKEGLIQIRDELKVTAAEASGEYTSLYNGEAEETASVEPKEVEVKPPPIVIHCSAGVGRTGTFCCLSNSIERLNNVGTIDIFSTVKYIRDQRAFSVQTPEQYQFCYTGIIEYVIRERQAKRVDTRYLENFLFEFLHGELSSDSD